MDQEARDPVLDLDAADRKIMDGTDRTPTKMEWYLLLTSPLPASPALPSLLYLHRAASFPLGSVVFMLLVDSRRMVDRGRRTRCG